MEGMSTVEIILLIVNTPAIGGLLVWIIRVEKVLTEIQTTCKDRKRLNNQCMTEAKI